VHIDQWATYVNTPAPTTTAATVKVTTTVVNSGSASASVSLQGIVSDPSGKACQRFQRRRKPSRGSLGQLCLRCPGGKPAALGSFPIPTF